MEKINITGAEIEAVIGRANKLRQKKKSTLIVYYSTDRDKVIVQSKCVLLKSFLAQLDKNPERVAGVYQSSIPIDNQELLNDIKKLAKRVNGKPLMRHFSYELRENSKNTQRRKLSRAQTLKELKTQAATPFWAQANFPLTVKLKSSEVGYVA